MKYLGTISDPKDLVTKEYVDSKVSDIPTKSKVTFTPTTGASYANYGGCYYEVYGSIVHVHVGISGLTANSTTTIYTLPSAVRPSSIVFTKGRAGTISTVADMAVNTNGTVQVNSANTYAGADVTYMI